MSCVTKLRSDMASCVQFPLERYQEDLPGLKAMTQDSLVSTLKRFSTGFSRYHSQQALFADLQCDSLAFNFFTFDGPRQGRVESLCQIFQPSKLSRA